MFELTLQVPNAVVSTRCSCNGSIFMVHRYAERNEVGTDNEEHSDFVCIKGGHAIRGTSVLPCYTTC